MTIGPGSRFGQYEITGSLGKGGMGEVWRARDTKLERDVAIKTLPSTFADDPDRLARFEREAKLLASLNHANIAAIYGLDEHEGVHFLAMELVEGETLEEKLKAGALPVEDTLRIALQIAHALEAAHASGVVHRDLKPANIMLTGHDQVKVLDFGLAKAFAGNPMEASPAHSPALSVAMTQAGLILGTAGYMSPEQASGQATDQRADIWAFGVVLYEMLSGLPLFSGESVPHVLADVLRADPDWSRLPKRLHPRIRQLLERCLEKKVRNRYHAIADARVDIEATLADPEGAITLADAGAAAPIRSLTARLATGLGFVLAGAVITGLVAWSLWRAPEQAARTITRFQDVIEVPSNDIGEVAISRDGQHVAYLAGSPVGNYVRDLDDFDARPIPETVGVTNDVACFSPEGNWIAYVTDQARLRKVPIAGGRSLLLAEGAYLPGYCDWGDDRFVYFGLADGSIGRVPDTGGEVEPITTLESAAGELVHFYPQLLPGGETMLYSLYGGISEEADITVKLRDLTTGEETTLLERAGFASFTPSGPRPTLGHLIFGFDGALFAAPYDVMARQVGATSPVLDGVSGTNILTVSAVADNGTLAYFTGITLLEGGGVGMGSMALHFVDRSGAVEAVPLPPGIHVDIALSPDDPTLMLTELDLGSLTGDIWSYELDSGRRAPLTFEGHNYSPVFTRDGGYLVFGHADSISGGRPRLLALPTDRSDQQATTLLELDTGAIFPASIHPSEPVLVGTLGNTRTGANSVNGDIFLFTLPEDLSVDSDAIEPDLVVLATEFDERQPTFSPDGRWIAYSSNESGRHEIYVMPYPGPGRKEQVSVSGGTAPRWSPEGDELYFIADDALMAAGVETVEAGNRFRAGTPEVVLEDPRIVDESIGLTPASPTYTTTSDGSRLLILSPGSANASSTVRLNVVQNWYEELLALAPFPAGWE